MLTDILIEYRTMLKRISLLDAHAILQWLEEVAFWLARVQREDEYKEWVLRFAVDLQTKGGKPVELCLGVLEGHVGRELVKKGGLR